MEVKLKVKVHFKTRQRFETFFENDFKTLLGFSGSASGSFENASEKKLLGSFLKR